MSLHDPSWKYTPSGSTNVAATMRKHGFKPTTDAERKARQKRRDEPAAIVTVKPAVASITSIKRKA